MRCRKYILLFFLLLTAMFLRAQEVAGQQTVEDNTPAMVYRVQVKKVAYQGDSIPHVILPTLQKYPPLTFKNEKDELRYNRLVRNVKKVLPYAKLAKMLVIETYEVLEILPTKEAKKEHMERVEADLKRQYGPIFKKMTRSQGKLLIKLIDRECNQTGYHIAQAFIGSFKANAYQAFAFLFGQSLTKKYDPEGDDFFVERVVKMVESGQL